MTTKNFMILWIFQQKKLEHLLIKFIFYFLKISLGNRLISAGFGPVLSNIEKSCIVWYFSQFTMREINSSVINLYFTPSTEKRPLIILLVNKELKRIM